MPPIIQILILLAMAIVAVLFITSRNPMRLSEEQSAKYSGILRILVVVLLIAASIRMFI